MLAFVVEYADARYVAAIVGHIYNDGVRKTGRWGGTRIGRRGAKVDVLRLGGRCPRWPVRIVPTGKGGVTTGHHAGHRDGGSGRHDLTLHRFPHGAHLRFLLDEAASMPV